MIRKESKRQNDGMIFAGIVCKPGWMSKTPEINRTSKCRSVFFDVIRRTFGMLCWWVMVEIIRRSPRMPFLPLLVQRRIVSLGALASVQRQSLHPAVLAHFSEKHIPFRRSCSCQVSRVLHDHCSENLRLVPYIREVGFLPEN